jgi:hypothetical protein
MATANTAPAQVAPHPELNWERCAELHNRILDIGWAALEETGWEPDLESRWNHYFGNIDSDTSEEDEEGAENNNQIEEETTQGETDNDQHDHDENAAVATELGERLAPSIISFLKAARYDCPGFENNSNFFYYLKGLSSPSSIMKSLNAENHIALERDRHI